MIIERPMSTAQVAKTIGVSRATILTMARRAVDPLPSMKVGAHYRFFWSDVVKFFAIPADKVVDSNPPLDNVKES
jgi:excisionase family DNA binding protein